MSDRSTIKVCLTIACLNMVIIGSAVDIFIPSLNAISEHFQVASSYSMLLVPTYLISFAIFHLLSGLFITQSNKRIYLIVALCLFAVLCFVSTVSNLTILIILRFVQGALGAIIAVVARTLLADYCEGPVLRKYLSYLTMAWSLGPIASPFIGGILQTHYGWQAPFIALGIYSSMTALFSILFLSKKPVLFTPKTEPLTKVITNLKFSSYATTCGLAYAHIIIFQACASFLVMRYIDNNASIYGYIALLLGLCWVAGNFTCRFAINSSYNTKLRVVFMSLMGLMPILQILAIKLNLFAPLFFVIANLIAFFCAGFIFTSNYSDALSQQRSPAASAYLGFLNAITAGLFGLIGHFSNLDSYLKVNIMFVLIAAIIYITYLLSTHRPKKPAADSY